MDKNETASFVFFTNWITDLDMLDLDMQNKIIAEIARYGAGLPLKYEDDPIIYTFAKTRFGSIDNVKAKYQAKIEQSKNGGRPTKVDHLKIKELKAKGIYTAEQIAEMVGCSVSTVNREKLS